MTKIFYFDTDGYFQNVGWAQSDKKGKLLMPGNATTVAPELDESYFYKWDKEQEVWQAEKKPTDASELVNQVIDHKSQTPHMIELRKIVENLTKDNPNYRDERGSKEEGYHHKVVRVPEKTIEELRSEKLTELNSSFINWYEDKATMTSSLGFVADSDSRAMMDVNGLVTTLEAQPAEARATVAFMDANNQPHLLTLEQLKTVQVEIIQNGQSAYQQKWALRTAIESAQSKEELDAIEIKFTAEDFSK